MILEVKEQSAERLRLVLKTKGTVYLLFGWGFVALGLLVIQRLGDRVELKVSDGELRYTRTFLGIFPREEFLVAAEEVSSIAIVLRKGFGTSYEVGVETVGRPLFHATLPISDGDAKRAIAAAAEKALTAEVADTADLFVHRESGVPMALALGGLCLAAGIACWYFIQTVIVSADRRKGVLTVLRRRHFSFSRSLTELELAEVIGIETRACTMHTGRHQTTSHQVHIHLEEKPAVPLAIGPMFTKNSAKGTAKVIREWLGKDGPS